ncbi:MAG: flagellar M-ring protein FliF, partial [Myxococcaceae bacterium]
MRTLALVLGVLSVGCSAQVQHGLDERQANEIQTVLLERGFGARKRVEEGRPPTWAVEVEP